MIFAWGAAQKHNGISCERCLSVTVKMSVYGNKRVSKKDTLSRLGYVSRNERVTNVCRTQMRDFKLNVEQEKNN